MFIVKTEYPCCVGSDQKETSSAWECFDQPDGSQRRLVSDQTEQDETKWSSVSAFRLTGVGGEL